MSINSLYETDFYAWIQQQIELLQAEKWQELDRTNLIEEIESLGRKERQELRNRLGILLAHLLKWQFQPTNRSNSWLSTIREQRLQINLLLSDSPSLKSYLSEALAIADELALTLALQETQLGEEIFPETCPYTLEQILDSQFLPNGADYV
ncbi:MAG: DUF29 domain-containing protein [Chloroflexaceae bacterium]|nr:DUF29 domain-containing protein [Chloroflexaceae bacterium]